MIITADKTSVIVDVYFVDDDGGTAPGEPKTGLLFSNIETGGSASYHRQGEVRVDFTLITQTAAGAYDEGGFVLVDDTNMPGVYRLDVPDGAFATGVDYVVIQLVAAAANNTIMSPLLIDLTDVDLREGVRAGLTALPDAAADAIGGLPISDLGGLDLDAILDDTSSTIPTLIAGVQSDTDDIQSRLPASLIGGRMDSDVEAINNSTLAAIRLALSTEVIVIGEVEAGTLSTTQMTTDLTELTTNHYVDRVILWTSGPLKDQATDITAYDSVGGLLTFSAVTELPIATNAFIIV
jgi:hypothetical protein